MTNLYLMFIFIRNVISNSMNHANIRVPSFYFLTTSYFWKKNRFFPIFSEISGIYAFKCTEIMFKMFHILEYNLDVHFVLILNAIYDGPDKSSK